MNSKCSQSEPIRYGVPQGSILGPLMFLIFINDLPLVLKDAVTSFDLYADDTTVYDIQSNMQTLQQNLQKSLSLLRLFMHNGIIFIHNSVISCLSMHKEVLFRPKVLPSFCYLCTMESYFSKNCCQFLFAYAQMTF